MIIIVLIGLAIFLAYLADDSNSTFSSSDGYNSSYSNDCSSEKSFLGSVIDDYVDNTHVYMDKNGYYKSYRSEATGITYYENGKSSYDDMFGQTHYSDGTTSYEDSIGIRHYSDGRRSYEDCLGRTVFLDDE